MSIGRQGPLFALVGGLQWFVDWLVFVVLSASGMAVAPANVLARLIAAGAGFWLNGRLTFADQAGARLGGARLLRFGLLWLALTALSTGLITRTASAFGLREAWLAKPLVEALLAVVSFVLQRHWVYR